MSKGNLPTSLFTWVDGALVPAYLTDKWIRDAAHRYHVSARRNVHLSDHYSILPMSTAKVADDSINNNDSDSINNKEGN